MRADGDERLQRAEQRRDEELARRLEAADAAEHAPEAAAAAAPAPAEAAQEVPAESAPIASAPPAEPSEDLDGDVPGDEIHVEDAGDEEVMESLLMGLDSWRPSRHVVGEATRLFELSLTAGASAGDARAKIVELVSPPRVTGARGRLPPMSLAGGPTYDPRQDANGRSWDFRRADRRQLARAEIAMVRPYLVVGSPPCTELSAIQRSAAEERRRLAEARALLGFAAEIYDPALPT